MSNEPDSTQESQLYDLSRRKVLAGMGAVGLASVGAGLGTSALFSDTESFTGNILQAGELDIVAVSTSSYNGAAVDSFENRIVSADGPAETFYTLDDVKPGDSGKFDFCFELYTNPAYIWLCGEQTEDLENGQNEPELETEGLDEDGLGELDDSIVASAYYCEVVDGEKVPVDGGEIVSDVSLAELLGALNSGLPLNYDGVPAEPGNQSPYQPSEEEGMVTGACVCVDWELPIEVGNEIQSDSLAFDVAVHAYQARNTDGTMNPCDMGITTRTGEGFAKQQEFGDGVEASFARGRFGDNGPSGAWEVAIGTPGPSIADQANYVWTPGATVPFSYVADGSGNASFTLDDVTVSSGAIPAPNGKLAITTKADEATIEVANLALDLDGSSVALNGPTGVTASNDGSGREVSYLVFDTSVSDVQNGFEISGDVTVDIQGDYSGSDEGVAFDISVE
jgi:predicted ribosomally synthesized peptide with SipW-like signal peptide